MISFNPTLNAPGKCGEQSRLAEDAARNLEVWALESTLRLKNHKIKKNYTPEFFFSVRLKRQGALVTFERKREPVGRL
jgi:hypothetical protein